KVYSIKAYSDPPLPDTAFENLQKTQSHSRREHSAKRTLHTSPVSLFALLNPNPVHPTYTIIHVLLQSHRDPMEVLHFVVMSSLLSLTLPIRVLLPSKHQLHLHKLHR